MAHADLDLPEVGARFRTATERFTPESIAAFARAHDPQAMHFDDDAARASVFGELVASGWQTACVTMRLMVEADVLGGRPLIGLEVQAMKFAAPVRPGDAVRAEAEVLSARATRRGDRGLVRLRVVTRVEEGPGAGLEVLRQEWTVLVVPRG